MKEPPVWRHEHSSASVPRELESEGGPTCDGPIGSGRASGRQLVLAWMALFAILALPETPELFQGDLFEEGDYAANALTIENAKSFTEIYGNYSRFGFRHPGPAYFTVYGVTELVFSDAMGVMQPHGAHLLAGVLLQTFFLAVALWIASTWSLSPYFLPLAAAVALGHFGVAAEDAIYSIWAPTVMAVPSLTLLVACASLSLGRVGHLPFAAVAAGFLLHGHVAQPMFVLPPLLLCYGLGWYHHRETDRSWLKQRAQVVTFVVFLVFALPWAIDLTRGSDSNLAHVASMAGSGHHTPAESVLHMLGLLAYGAEGEGLAEIWSRGGGMLVGFGVAVLGALTTLLASVGRARLERSFQRRLMALFFLSFLLTLYWGTMQRGPMHQFNSHFFFGVMLLPPLVLVLELSKRLPSTRGKSARHLRLGVAASWGFALLVGGGCFLGDSLPAIHDIEVPRTLDRIVADQRESQPVLLEFAHGAWPRAISLALALERRGLPWLVSDDWGFVFGHEHRASRHQGRAPEAWVVTREDVSAGGRSYRFE